MKSQDFFAGIANELSAVENELYRSIVTGVPELRDASEHLIKAGGKRLRPAFVLLTGAVFQKELNAFVPMATALELIHMASLVHDDVIDHSPARRGIETVMYKYGNRMSIYSGDYVFARSLALVASYKRADLISLLADGSVRMCEGEITQMRSCFDVKQTMRQYLKRIERKTALLMSLSCQMGALIAEATEEQVKSVTRYGYHLGMAFQITDDVLDFTADEETLGKPTGSDIRQGVITLPALYALRYSPDRRELAQYLASPMEVQENAERCIEIVTASQGIDYSLDVAEKYVHKAQRMLERLPRNQATDTLFEIADFIRQRDF